MTIDILTTYQVTKEIRDFVYKIWYDKFKKEADKSYTYELIDERYKAVNVFINFFL